MLALLTAPDDRQYGGEQQANNQQKDNQVIFIHDREPGIEVGELQSTVCFR